MFSSTQDLNDKSKKVADDLHDGVRRVKGVAQDTADNVSGDLNSTARSAGRYVRDFADNAEASMSDAASTVTSTVRDNPVSSTFIALGVGILIGMLVRR